MMPANVIEQPFKDELIIRYIAQDKIKKAKELKEHGDKDTLLGVENRGESTPIVGN